MKSILPSIMLPFLFCCSQEEKEEPVTSIVYTSISSTLYFSSTCSGEGIETPLESLLDQRITLYSDGGMEMFTGAHCDHPSIETQEECVENGECDCDFTLSSEECNIAECSWSLYEWSPEYMVEAGYTQEGIEITINGSAQTDVYDDITITLIEDILTWNMILDDGCIVIVYQSEP